MNDRIEKLKEYVSKKACGTRGKYVSGCRCTDCRRANSEYQKKRERMRAAGVTNPIVDAAPAREHLKKLSREGIGYKTVAEYSGAAASVLMKVRSGERTRIRKSTLERIMAVDRKCFREGTLLRAGQTWTRIKWMLDEGLTKTAIAKRLGCRTRALQIGRKRVTGKTHSAIERLYNQYRLGE